MVLKQQFTPAHYLQKNRKYQWQQEEAWEISGRWYFNVVEMRSGEFKSQKKYSCKVQVFLEGHKNWQNLHRLRKL